MKLIYKIMLSTSSPFGHFEVVVDAHDGKVVKVKDAALPRMKRSKAASSRSQNKSIYNSISHAIKAFQQKNQKSFMTSLAMNF